MSVRHLLPTHAELVGQCLASFGGFDRARAVAGLDAPPLEHDPEVVIGALRSLARSGVRLDATTLSTMGEGALVTACVETFGGVPAATAKAGLAPPPEPVRAPPERRDERRDERSRDRDRDRDQPGFAQPPLSADGQVSTSQALEVLQATAVALNRVPAARDLPPDVARRLTSDYGSVRFAYLALRVHAGGGEHSAESAAAAAAEPVARVSQEAFAATARLPDAAGQNRRNVENHHAAVRASELSDAEYDAMLTEVEARIDEAAAVAGEQLRQGILLALEAFVDEVGALARRHTLESLLPFTENVDDEPEPEPEPEPDRVPAEEP